MDEARSVTPHLFATFLTVALLCTPAILGSSARAGSTTAARAPTADLNEFRVEGNTLLPQRDIESVLYEFLGPERSVQDVERARAALEDLYTKRGYPTVSASVPRQSGADGIVTIEVVERPVGRLRVVGARNVAPSAITAETPSLAVGKVLQMTDVQRDLMLVNQLPDRTITPVLRPGRDPGTVDVDLKVDDHSALHGSLELNNRNGQQTTALRSVGSLSYNNLWQRGDSVSVGFQVAPQRPSDAKVGSASYLYRIPGSRMSVQGSYIQSDSNVSTLGGASVVGRGKIAGLRLIAPLSGDEGFAQSLNFGVDYKNLTQDVGVGGQFTSSPITYIPFSAGYLASWSSAGVTTEASGTIVWAFRGIGSDFTEFDNKRLNAPGNFSYVKADVSHTRGLPFRSELYAHATMQVSPDPLVSSEQLSLGGMETVRGYFESESLGDYGGSGQLEIRGPSLARFIGPSVNSLRFHAFVDAGATKIHQPQLDQRSSDTLASTGVGVSVRLFDSIGGEVDDAQVLISGPATKNGTNRVLFRLYGDF